MTTIKPGTIPEHAHRNAVQVAEAIVAVMKGRSYVVPAHERIEVVAFDNRGRIAEMTKTKVPARDEREIVARRFWLNISKTVADADAESGEYMRLVAQALGRGRGFSDRLSALADSPKPLDFWARADRWTSGGRALFKAVTALEQRG